MPFPDEFTTGVAVVNHDPAWAEDYGALRAIGFRLRPEPWHRTATVAGQECRKLVGSRSASPGP
ncbi:MAG TPA: hypothetical protein VHW44_08470 [Pseudonocardiaceae bacterium]|nr:hypothetical protein [Pseudonocardiaceae bacterium]